MPGLIRLVEMSSIATCLLELLRANVKPSGLKTGSFILPGRGAAVPGVGRMLSLGADACASPRSSRLTTPLNSSLRETVKVGPSTGVTVIAGSVMRDGGVIEK